LINGENLGNLDWNLDWNLLYETDILMNHDHENGDPQSFSYAATLLLALQLSATGTSKQLENMIHSVEILNLVRTFLNYLPIAPDNHE
jgi:hypothetical protein